MAIGRIPTLDDAALVDSEQPFWNRVSADATLPSIARKCLLKCTSMGT